MLISENYVSFETAKLLKEKGFNGPCRAIYSQKGVVRHYLKEEVYEHHLKGHKKLCPTLQMVMKWLREVHKIDIIVCLIDHNTVTMEQDYYFFKVYKDRRPLSKNFYPELYHTYEQTIEAAIKYVLENLI